MPIHPDDLELDAAVVDRLSLIMAELDGEDFELVDPPDWLWDRIAASIAPAHASTGSGTIVEYCIDADDLVIAVDGDWEAFATENGAPELIHLNPSRTLWSYFDNDEVRTLWQLLVQQVRTQQTDARVSLRCDAPHMRRWFDMTITPEPNNTVRFRSLLVFEQSRPDIGLLSTTAERDSDAPAVPLCSWCNKGQQGSEWREIEELVRDLRLLEEPMPSITYGICPICRDRMTSDLMSQSSPDAQD